MTAKPLPLDVMEWMGMDEAMVPFVLDGLPAPADPAADEIARTTDERLSAPADTRAHADDHHAIRLRLRRRLSRSR